MSSHFAGAITGALTSAALGIAIPTLGTVRWLVSACLLTSAIIVAAWYLP